LLKKIYITLLIKYYEIHVGITRLPLEDLLKNAYLFYFSCIVAKKLQLRLLKTEAVFRFCLNELYIV